MARVPARQSAFGQMFGNSGGRGLPSIVLVLIIATAAMSIIGIVGERHGIKLLTACALVTSEVLRGQGWRLFTWVFFEIEPWNLVLACLGIYWFARDLATRWGTVRFIITYLGLAALIGALTVVTSLFYAPLRAIPQLGSWAILDALVILWASYYPTQQILMMFVIPMSGRRIVYFTIGATVLLALFRGIDSFVPNFIAEGIAVAVMFLPSPRELWIERKLRNMEHKRKATHLRSVPRDAGPHDEPPKSDGSNGRWLN
ncbi:MAG: rhomboid family intramembrane serine protease [Polyangia bacterium]